MAFLLKKYIDILYYNTYNKWYKIKLQEEIKWIVK